LSQNYETFGNYILLEKIAAGGMAEVYLAKKLAASGVQKFVAIKRILSQYSDSKEFIQMFKDEAKIAINLNHSNIVSIFDFGIQTDQFYIVMEYVEGRNLRQILNRMKKKGKRFSTAQIVQLMAQTSAGLEHAHRCIDPTTGQPLNIIHRDMSPQNVMLTFEGEAKIVDFGIAKAATQAEATRAGTLKGKFGYMSPEQVEGQIIDSRTDIFALGIMIWEMLSGQRLFLSSNELNTLRSIRECKVPSLRDINPNIPIELDQIVQKALQKDKSQRYQTCAELSRDLFGFLNRFAPDFSTQDFSIFIKDIYSEEIVATRKKQIMFAQINVAASHQEYAEKTVVMTQTESEVASDITFEDMSLNTVTKSVVNGYQRSAPAVQRTQQGFANPTLTKTPQLQKTEIRPPANTTTKARHHRKRSRSGSFIPIALFFSLLLGSFAYLLKEDPELKNELCNLLSEYEVCSQLNLIPATSGGSTGFLEITTTPPGANVYINGEKMGRSPMSVDSNQLPFLASARYIGYRASHKEIKSMPETNQLNFQLERINTGFVKVHVTGAQIFINQLKVKKGMQNNVPANEPVEIRLYNPVTGASQSHSVTLEKGETKELFYSPPK